MLNKIIIPSIVVALISNANAVTVVYNLVDQSFTSDIEAGSYLQGGVILSLGSTDGALNQTSTSFGINHSGGSSDETSQIDGDEGNETLTFSFNVSGVLNQLDFTQFGANDIFTLKKGITTIFTLVDSGSSDVFLIGESFTTSDVFSLTFTEGSVIGGGASLDAIKITAIPEPSSSLFLGFSGLALLVRRKRSASSKALRLHSPSNYKF